MHNHHIIPRCKGGSNDPDNLLLVDPVEHARIHALDFIEGGPWFDFRHEGWPLLEPDLQNRVREEASRRKIEYNKSEERPKGYSRSEEDKRKRSERNKALGVVPPGVKGLKKPEKERREIAERTRKVMTGRKHFNNGERMVYAYECPEGFVPGGLRRPKKS
jgi:hypothetical protein